MSDKDTFIQQLRQERDNLKSKSDELFLAHEAFIVQISCTLGLDYTDTSDEDILKRVKELKDTLREVLEWIENWEPIFTGDPEWETLEDKAKELLEGK